MTSNTTTIALSCLAGAVGAVATLTLAHFTNFDLSRPVEVVASAQDQAVNSSSGNAASRQQAPTDTLPQNPPQNGSSDTPEAPDSTTSADLPLAIQNELEFLREEVELARREREQLETEVQGLRQEIEGQGPGDFQGTGLTSDANTAVDTDRANQITATRSAFNPPTRNERLASLQAAGVDAQVALGLQQRIDEQQLARLELTDRAEREGWRRSDRFRDEVTSLNENQVDLAEEIGPDRFDRYLFESGQNNRVVIDSVIDGSAASFAGMVAGDVILRYADTPVFTVRGLQAATRTGTRGESITINALRNGDQLVFDVPRGPLGVTLTGLRTVP